MFARSLLALALSVVGALIARAESPLPAPQAAKQDVVDDFFGTKVADPYRWLEDESLPETQAFINAQNARTHAYVDTPQRQQIRQRITELYNFPRQTAPTRRERFIFYSTNTGLQNQNVMYVTEKLDNPGRVLIDPNKLSQDGTVSITQISYTEDGTLMAYGLAQSGSDHSDIRVKNVATGEDLPDVIPPARNGGVEWKHDNSGFYYGQFPRTAEHGRAEQAYNYKLYFHKLGTQASQDMLVYERPDDREMSFGINITHDGKYEFLSLSRGTKRENRLYWRAANVPGDWNKLVDDENFTYSVVGNEGPIVYIRTTDDAPRGRLIAIDLDHSSKEAWKTILPETKDVLSSVNHVGAKFVVTYSRDAHKLLQIFNNDGSLDRNVELPTIGSVDRITARPNDTDFFYTFNSFTYPSTIFRYDLKTSQQTVHFASQVKFRPDDFETVQKFATSKDGTKVPVFITYKKGISQDGNNPCILGGYGGFTVSTTPGFSSTRIAWLERGGISAAACLRGGGEYGEAWHRGGMLEKKQNVFDDFHAAAQLLIEERYTSSRKLAIQGGSNGGLLVAACMLEHPETYGAVVCQVPVIDMLRYHKLGIGRFWTVEYGNAEASADQFKYLYAYSPLHNVKPGVSYPPILITTGEGDNRVVPGHSYKFAATLQARAGGSNPILLRVESKAGHGGGKPTTKVIDEVSDIYSFLMKTFEMN